MNLKSLLAATALCSVMIAPAHAQTAPKMRDVLQAWQLDKPTATTQFVTKSVTEDRAVIENLVFKGKETKTSDISFGQLVLQRMPAAGVAAESDRFSLTFENGTTFSEDGEKTSFGKIEVTGLTQASNLEALTRWVGGDTRGGTRGAATLGQTGFEGDIRVSNIVSQLKGKDGQMGSGKIGALNLVGVRLSPDSGSTKSMELVGLEFLEADGNAKLGRISVTDFKMAGLEALQSASTFEPKEFDFKKVSFGSMLVENLSMEFETGADKEKPEKSNLAMGRMELSNWAEKNIGRFSLSGMKVTTGEAEKRVDMGLDSLTLDDINLVYFGALGSAFMKIVPNLEPKPTGRSALMGFADLASASASVAATSKATPAPATPSPKLKDLLPGGPLDGGIGAINMSNFAVGFQGFNFTIDRIATRAVRNGDGIITATKLEPITMKLTVPEALLNQPDSPMAMFAPLLSDGIELVIGAEAKYDPVTDIATLNDLNYTFKGWAGVNLDFAMDGLGKFYREQTVDALIGPLAEDLKKANAPKGKGAKKPDPTAQLKQSLAIYQGMRFLNGALELRDQGGIAKAAGVFASMMAPPAKGATSRSATQDAQAVAQVRQSWAEPLRKSAAEKNKSIMERQFLISLARWIEIGGVMTAAMQPPVPVELPSLADPKDLPTRLGITFTNQPPAKN